MNGKLKALGLALVAVFALSAVAASGASAVTTTIHHVTAELEPPEKAHLTAEAKDTAGNPSKQVFKETPEASEEVVCHEVEVHGTVEKTQESVTVEPTYEECEVVLSPEESITAHVVNNNGCHYLFTGKTTTGNPTGGEHAEVHIVGKDTEREKTEEEEKEIEPEPCKIEIKVTAFTFKCLSIGEQSLPDAVRYHDQENGHIMITATTHGITSTETESVAGCGSATHTTGTYTGDVTVSAHDTSIPEPKPVNLSLSQTTEEHP